MAQADRFSRLVMCLPGSEIPGWFNYQSVGDRMKIQIPPENWYNSKLMELVVCAVFQLHNCDSSSDIVLSCSTIGLYCSGFGVVSGFPKRSTYMSDQLFFVFFSRGSCSKLLDSIELNFSLTSYKADKQKRTMTDDTSIPAKIWGFHIVFEQDIEDLIQSNNNLGFPYNFDKVSKAVMSSADVLTAWNPVKLPIELILNFTTSDPVLSGFTFHGA